MSFGHRPVPAEMAFEAKAAWDAADPPIMFDDLVTAWQWVVVLFVRAVASGATPEAAWQTARPVTDRQGLSGGDSYLRTLRAMAAR